jgi:hypothetical protein
MCVSHKYSTPKPPVGFVTDQEIRTHMLGLNIDLNVIATLIPAWRKMNKAFRIPAAHRQVVTKADEFAFNDPGANPRLQAETKVERDIMAAPVLGHRRDSRMADRNSNSTHDETRAAME